MRFSLFGMLGLIAGSDTVLAGQSESGIKEKMRLTVRGGERRQRSLLER